MRKNTNLFQQGLILHNYQIQYDHTEHYRRASHQLHCTKEPSFPQHDNTTAHEFNDQNINPNHSYQHKRFLISGTMFDGCKHGAYQSTLMRVIALLSNIKNTIGETVHSIKKNNCCITR